jgi:integrase
MFSEPTLEIVPMTSSLAGEVPVTPSPSAVDASLTHLREVVRGLVDRSRATSTNASYASSWGAFERWATVHGLTALPADGSTVSLYVAHMVSLGRSTATVHRVVAALSQVHIDRGQPSPRQDAHLRRVLRGVARSSPRSARRKSALSRVDVTRMVAVVGIGLAGVRDAALVALGWGTGLRRAELVALDVGDVTFTTEGLTLRIGRSKTDQEAVGRRVGVPNGGDPATDPVGLLRAWLTGAALASGPLFRGLRRGGRVRDDRMSPKSVALIVQRLAAAAGLDPRWYAGHSLRSGYATTAAREGVPDRLIAAKLGHRSLATTAIYISDARID